MGICSVTQGTQTRALWQPRGWDGWKAGGRVKREQTYMHPWQIHAAVWQKPTHCKAIIFQLKILVWKGLKGKKILLKTLHWQRVDQFVQVRSRDRPTPSNLRRNSILCLSPSKKDNVTPFFRGNLKASIGSSQLPVLYLRTELIRGFSY